MNQVAAFRSTTSVGLAEQISLFMTKFEVTHIAYSSFINPHSNVERHSALVTYLDESQPAYVNPDDAF